MIDQQRVLVTGGCGFIGSNMTNLLLQKGYMVTVIDDLSNSYHLPIKHPNLNFINANISQSALIKKILSEQHFEAIFYFSASIESKISMENPAFYLRNNVINALNFLEIVLATQSQTNFIFSSTAAVYKSKNELIKEDDEKQPENVYGKTKLFIEQVLEDYGKIHGLKYAILRYFNACGADIENKLGENRKYETHLIPLLMRSMVRKDYDFSIYGNNYKTPDGTCIRDYVHVKDIALAHLAMMEFLPTAPNAHYCYNIGSAQGYSVLEIVEKAVALTKLNFNIKYKSPRAGDPDCLVASNQKIAKELKWQPLYSDLDNIIDSAWQWEKFLLKN